MTAERETVFQGVDLLAALREYGGHKFACAQEKWGRGRSYDRCPPCDCGWAEIAAMVVLGEADDAE